MAAPVIGIVLSSISGPPYVVTRDGTISGKVTFSNEKNHLDGVVTISLIGRAQTIFKKGTTLYNGKATVCHLSQTLHDGMFRQSQYEWPFEFTFPSVTGTEKKKWLAVPPFQVTEGHELPPSMAFEAEESSANRGKGAVAYVLESTFSKPPKSSAFDPSHAASLLLYYIPYRNAETPAQKFALLAAESFTCASKLLNPAGEKRRSFFQRMKTPSSVFEIAIHAPHVVYAGGPLNITLTLKHDLQNSSATEVPVVKLTSCTVTLLRTVHAAGRAIFDDDTKFPFAELLFEKENLDIQLSESQNLSDLLSLPSFQTNYGITFGTYNLAQTFKLMVKVTLDCVDKKFWAELRGRNVTVLSAFTKDMIEKGEFKQSSPLSGMGTMTEGIAAGEAGESLLWTLLGISAVI